MRPWSLRTVLTVGSSAMSAYEPGQVRKEAAISKITLVPEGGLTRAVL